jgi:drug/metabolite transporter (DMT)-like permease
MVKLSRGQWLALLALTLIWGVNWPMMKFSLRELTPLYFRACTMTAGALMLYALYRWRAVDMGLPRQHLAAVVVLALPNILGWHLLSIWGVQALASGRAAILGFTMPMWTVLLGALLFGQRLSRRSLFSLAAGVLAVGLLVGEELGAIAGRPLGVLWMQLAAVSWALGTLLMRRSTLPLATEAITVWMMLLSAGAFWALALLLEPVPTLQFSAAMWASLAWGAAVNYGVAQVIWFGMARKLPPQASTFAIMAVPLVGVASATVVVGEIPRWTDALAALFVMLAIASALWPSAAPLPAQSGKTSA